MKVWFILIFLIYLFILIIKYKFLGYILEKEETSTIIVVINFLPVKKLRKKIEKENPKIQEDTHKESLEDCPSWWLRTKMTSEKVREQ